MGCQQGNNYGMAAQARSRHTGGVNSCFADGHVQFVRDTISQRTWVLSSPPTMVRFRPTITNKLPGCAV
jgi:prepilin-type processing-associated H-X9-DG protein